MNLSECLGWEKIEIEIGVDGKAIYPEQVGFNNALTACDREIDREALENILTEEFFKQTMPRDMANKIISTMPTWLKRIESK